MSFNSAFINNIVDKFKNHELNPSNISEVNQWITSPLLSALGYDIFSQDVIPNYNVPGTHYTVEFLIKNRSKAVMIVQSLSFNAPITSTVLENVSKNLHNDIRVALITNGKNICVYSDTEKRGVLDSEPQFEVNLANFKMQDYFKLNLISNEKIDSFEPKKPVKHKKEINKVCESLVKGLKIRAIPNWVVEGIIKETGIPQEEIDKSYVIKAFARTLYEEFDGFRISDQMAAENKQKAVVKEESEYCSCNEYTVDKIPLDLTTKYVIEKIEVLGTEYDDRFIKYIYIDTLKELLRQGIIQRDDILRKFPAWFKTDISGVDKYKKAHYIFVDELGVYAKTAFNAKDLLIRTNKLLKFAKQPSSSVKVTLAKRVF